MPVYIARKGLEVSCYFDPNQPAELAKDVFLRINYEGYFFCNAEERARFQADVVTYCGLLTDPVSKQRFRPHADSPRATHEGVLYYFEALASARLFEREPGDYILPGYKMMDEEGVPEGPEG